MVVEADVITGEKGRQIAGRKSFAMDRDRRVVGPQNALEHRSELLVAIDEDRFHERLISHA